MSKLLSDTDPGKGLLRIGLRLPILLYRAHLGRFLGGRFLMLTTTGRKTGLPHRTVLEVVFHDKESDTYYIASGWGEKADWFRNVQKNPKVKVSTGRRQFEAEAVRLFSQDAEGLLLAYAGQHPNAARYLANVLTGEKSNSSKDQAASLAHSIPLIAIQPISQLPTNSK